MDPVATSSPDTLPGAAPAESIPGKNSYTCPMHPEVRQARPGDCPKCGMALELATFKAGAEAEADVQLEDMNRRLWIGAAFALPVFLLAMAHMIPGLSRLAWVESSTARWIQAALTTPVVWWAGWPFWRRGVRSIATWHLNMFTLITIGVGAAYLFSTVAMVFP